jgi:hypothetical protein
MPMMPCSFRVVTEPRYAEGGLAQAAQRVNAAGRNGDSVVVHLAPEEFAWLRENWGEPTTNPETGLPEYFKVADLFRAAAPFIPLLSNVVAPGLASSIGSALLPAGSTWAPALGSALIGAGAGALANGAQGALGGALAGATSPGLADALRGGLAGGAIGNVLGIPAAAGNQPAGAAQAAAGQSGGGRGASPAPSGGKSAWAPLLAGGAGLLMGSSLMSRPPAPAPPPQMPSSTFKPTNYQLQSRAIPSGLTDWYQYGQRPQTDATDPKFLERAWSVAAADGGSIHAGPLAMLAAGGGERAQGPVSGPGTGRSDEIPARLSDGEYVIDAETVALLGDGSSDAGAKRLDQFRENIRAHKGGALSRGKISPDAKPPEHYLQRRN